MNDDDADRITLELPAEEPYELDEEERIEVLLEWAPMVGFA